MIDGEVEAKLDRLSFIPGETVQLVLTFRVPQEDLQTVSNISVDFFKVEVRRNQFAFGFGSAPTCNANSLQIGQGIPASVQPGLYVVHSATLCRGENLSNQQTVNFRSLFFVVRSAAQMPVATDELNTMINDLEMRRSAYVHCRIRTNKADQCGAELKSFHVLVFGVGCLLHAHQQLEGYFIAPLGAGFSHRRLCEIVDTTLRNLGIEGLAFMEETERQFGSSTPTFLVSYNMVEAVDHDDALEYCRHHAAVLFEILGLDRGQMPREFACMAIEYGSNRRWHLFMMPGYRGNLLSDFNPVSTANRIEDMLPKLRGDPFLRLLTKTFAEATAEEDYGFSLLRCWSVLELVADREIGKGRALLHPDGSPILNPRGNPETTNSKHGRVYQYIMTRGAYKESGTYTDNGVQRSYIIGRDSSDPNYAPTTDLISLWEMVRAVYEIRNAVAHEGQFNPTKAATGDSHQQLAARLKNSGNPDPLRFIKEQARHVIWREAR